MENQFTRIASRFWNACLKPFLMAIFLGIMAGAFLNGLAHAGQQESRFNQLRESPPSVCAGAEGVQPPFSPE